MADLRSPADRCMEAGFNVEQVMYDKVHIGCGKSSVWLWLGHWQNSSCLEYRTEKDLEKLESPRVFHTQLLQRMLPESVWEQKCKIVYVQRNTKDVVVSAYNQMSKQVWKDNPIQKPNFTGTWEDYVHIFLEGGLCKRNTEIGGVPGTPSVNDIDEACSFQKLKYAAENVKDQTFHIQWNSDSEGYFRKGIVGNWKNWFTVAQSEKMDRFYEEKMKEKSSITL